MRRLSALSLLLLTACSNDYRFSSNLDPDNFEDYFAAGNVVLVDTLPPQAEALGVVEGQSCQREAQDPAPNGAEARTDMRRNAAQLGADAVKLLRCSEVDPEASGCLALMVCYGQALRTAK
ncbi:Rcs stress response system protein RcsF [Ferrimonas gelatinilytica]|uniref:Rcs stress response system protein RcsF n=1 Tax=Ferrimonas gelatinilytica TaxID=1255257 RepID=A0ABP9S295_9GAMM